MRLVRYDRNGAPRLGALDGDSVVDLLDAAPVGTAAKMLAAFADMTRLIAAGDEGIAAARTAVKSAGAAARIPLAKAKLRAPLAPALILCSGENYWDHREEKPEVTRKDPEFFLKTGLGVIGPGDDIVRDERVTHKLDYETELLIVIGKPGRHIPAARALEHVWGYTVMNDVTARDRQVTLRAIREIAERKHWSLQAVHVRSQRDDRPRQRPLQHRDDTGACDSRLRFEAEAPELFGDVFGRLHLAVGKLGMLMQVAAPLDQLRLRRGHQPIDLGRQGRRRLLRGDRTMRAGGDDQGKAQCESCEHAGL